MKSIIVFSLFFVVSSGLLLNPVFGEEMNFEMDWIIEGQINEQEISSEEAEIVSSYEELLKKNQKNQFMINL